MSKKPTRHPVARTLLLAAIVAAAPLGGGLIGCEAANENPETTGTIAGGLAGAAAGAAIGGEKNREGGAIIGGVIGAIGGNLIGGATEKSNDRDGAERAERRSREHPVTADDVDDARTADVNDDGFVTLDEVIAMERAGLDDDEMIDRLRRTQQVFYLSDEQSASLNRAGVDRDVIVAMRSLNRERQAGYRDGDDDARDRISYDRDRD